MAKAKKKKDNESVGPQIIINPLKRTVIMVKVESTTSLIMNDVTESAKFLEQKYNLSLPKGAPGYLENQAKIKEMDAHQKNPDVQFESSKWQLPGSKEKYGIPAVAFKKAMVRAGKLCGYHMEDLKCAFFVCSEIGRYIPIKSKKAVVHEDVVRQQGGQKMPTPRYRSEVGKWEATLRVEYDAGLISAESVVELINHAGFRVAVGDKRKQMGFEHGGFEVTVQKKKKGKKAA